MGFGETDVRAAAAIEALRLGVVNRYVAEHLTFGRERELEELESTIRRKRTGSTQVLAGSYGVGKSHLCEVLAQRLELAGYAVARIELGASHGRPESPRDILDSIRRSIALQHSGRRFQGSKELGYLVRALVRPSNHEYWGLAPLIRKIHNRMEGDDRVLDRFHAIRELYQGASVGHWSNEPQLIQPIRQRAMTAANLAVRAVNCAAHELHKAGKKGIVILFDEAERAETTSTPYRIERAMELLRGFALASANKDTSLLKHYRDQYWMEYRPYSPSRMHTIFCFTTRWGLSFQLATAVGTQILQLEPLCPATLRELVNTVGKLYGRAYGERIRLRPGDSEKIFDALRTGDTRAVVRRAVAALDHRRHEAWLESESRFDADPASWWQLWNRATPASV